MNVQGERAGVGQGKGRRLRAYNIQCESTCDHRRIHAGDGYRRRASAGAIRFCGWHRRVGWSLGKVDFYSLSRTPLRHWTVKPSAAWQLRSAPTCWRSTTRSQCPQTATRAPSHTAAHAHPPNGDKQDFAGRSTAIANANANATAAAHGAPYPRFFGGVKEPQFDGENERRSRLHPLRHVAHDLHDVLGVDDGITRQHVDEGRCAWQERRQRLHTTNTTPCTAAAAVATCVWSMKTAQRQPATTTKPSIMSSLQTPSCCKLQTLQRNNTIASSVNPHQYLLSMTAVPRCHEVTTSWQQAHSRPRQLPWKCVQNRTTTTRRRGL